MTDSMEDEERFSTLCDCLSNSRRRYALKRLDRAARPMALADLAEDVVDHETDASSSEADAETVKRVYMQLYHRHVPKLADADLVQYDQERDQVELLECPDVLDTAEPISQ